MPPSNSAVDAAKPGDKSWKLFDGKGLFPLVNPNGSKLWRRFAGKDQLLGLGSYPDVSLQARGGRQKIREQAAAGNDPSAALAGERSRRAISSTLPIISYKS